jgi:GT2 family glycosyltransferase
VTVIVVSRDRWSVAPATLDLLLARTKAHHPVVVVDGRAPQSVAAGFDRLAASGRISVVRTRRYLPGNEARNIGLERARTEWVAFVENDAVLSDGWLDALLEVGEARDAASVYPAYLQAGHRGLVVHGLGADLDVGGPPGRGYVRERQFAIGRPWSDVAPGLTPVARVQAEPHALLVRREVLDRMGGLDESLLSWFDHTDLALHHRRLGLESWFVPEVTCTYLVPPPLALHDVRSFLLRWSRDWYERSLDRLCTVWALDRHDTEWDRHATYRSDVRRGVMTRSRYVNAALDRASLPLERLLDRWNTRTRVS